MQDEFVKYRQVVTLADGNRVLFRAMTPDDRDAVTRFFAPISQEDARFMWADMTDGAVVDTWVDGLATNQLLPLLAFVNDRIVGNATLHFRGSTGPQRHIADVRIFLSKDYRRRGLGYALLRSAVDMAKRCGLQQLAAAVVADQVSVIHAFQRLGFECRATLPDYFMLPDGETHDVVLLILPLIHKNEEF